MKAATVFSRKNTLNLKSKSFYKVTKNYTVYETSGLAWFFTSDSLELSHDNNFEFSKHKEYNPVFIFIQVIEFSSDYFEKKRVLYDVAKTYFLGMQQYYIGLLERLSGSKYASFLESKNFIFVKCVDPKNNRIIYIPTNKHWKFTLLEK